MDRLRGSAIATRGKAGQQAMGLKNPAQGAGLCAAIVWGWGLGVEFGPGQNAPYRM